jgi:hypothetical protein
MTTARRFSASVQVAGAAALIVLLTRPLVFGGSDRGADFYTHYWYVWHQSEALREGGPSLFLHDTSAVFAPLYAFYGGTLYVVTGALALLLGSTLTAYVLTYVLAFAASYGGWWWLARQAGLQGFPAHAPGVVFLTTAYAMTLLYVRGDWPEHVAVAMLPLLAASGLSVLRADRLRSFPALALAISTMVFTGSHNLTLLCGATVLLATVVLMLVAVPEARRMVTRSGLARVVAIALPAVLVNAWFLLPDIVYQGDTYIASMRLQWVNWLNHFREYVDADHLFTLSRRTVEPGVPHYAFALPTLAMGWAVVACAAARPRLGDPWLRAMLVIAGVGAGLFYAMVNVDVLRGPFTMIQLSYRLESYINMMVAAVVLVGLVLLQGGPVVLGTVLRWALGAVAASSVLAAALQSQVHRDPGTYGEWSRFPAYYTPNSAPSIADYTQGGAAGFTDLGDAPRARFRPQAIEHGRLRATVNAAGGSMVVTNIVGVWSLLNVSGATFAAVDRSGRAVVRLDEGPRAMHIVTVRGANPPVVVIGRCLSALGLTGLLANAVVLVTRRHRRRRALEVEPAPSRDLAKV